jgi:hypothetical protein
MDRHRDAHGYAPARLRAEAHRLQEETKREPDPQTRQELTQLASLLEHTAEMLDTAEPDRQLPEYREP